VKENRQDTLRTWEAAYLDVMALYAAHKNKDSARVRRAELNLQNQVNAEPIDFICDVEIKARRVLSTPAYKLFMFICENSPDKAKYLPITDQQILGREFITRKLHLDGDYKTLFFRLKNQQARESVVEPTEEIA
jgi:hypothetical protein